MEAELYGAKTVKNPCLIAPEKTEIGQGGMLLA
jgi:hypothetical protein